MKHLAITFITLILFIIPSYAQHSDEMTPYESARTTLAIDTMKKILEGLSGYDKVSFVYVITTITENADDMYEIASAFENIIYKLYGLGNLFKTDANIMAYSIFPEDVYSANFMLLANDIGEQYKSERSKIEKTKTQNDVNRENARCLSTQGIGQITRLVGKDFRKWATKKETEKTVDYKNRILESGKSVFDSLCFKYSNEVWRNSATIEKLSYDADTEAVKLSFYYDVNDGKKSDQLIGYMNMSPDAYSTFQMKDIQLNQTYALGFTVINERIFPSSLRISLLAKLGKFTKYPYVEDVTFAKDQNLKIAITDIKNLPEEVTSALHEYVFIYDDFVSTIVSRTELYRMLYSISDKYYDAYSDVLRSGWKELSISPICLSDEWNHLVSFKTNNFDSSFKGDNQNYYNRAVADETVKAFDDDCINIVYDAFVKSDNYMVNDNISKELLYDVIRGCDYNAVINKIVTCQKLLLLEETTERNNKKRHSRTR